VTITGTGFVQGVVLSLDGGPIGQVQVVSPTTITGVTSMHGTGPKSLVIVNPATGQNDDLASAFYYSAPAPQTGFFTLPPCRLVDTRVAGGALGAPALAANQARVFDATGSCGIPNSAVAIAANLTVVTPGALGSFGIYPGDGFPLGSSALSFGPGQTRSAAAILPLVQSVFPGAGTFGIQNASLAASHLIVDVSGYFAP
jgi:hypothetical protein